MLSRRNIRIKVMQTLYSWMATPDMPPEEALKMYDASVERAYDLLNYQLYLLVKICENAVEDKKKRQVKLLPSDYDRNFTSKLNDNSITRALNSNKQLLAIWKMQKLDEITPDDFTRRLYKTFALSETYQGYILNDGNDEDHRQILLALYKDLSKHDFFNETIEDHYFNWEDDESIVIGTMKKIIKALPDCNSILEEYGPCNETVKDFGRAMLQYILEHNTDLETTVAPLIQNWDIERVALVDMILIKMSVTEMLIFPSIPTKVSINEYVELTKTYSTDKSKEFVNGVLDKVLHTLSDSKKISKSGRGLVE